jgi:hypothetical protein
MPFARWGCPPFQLVYQATGRGGAIGTGLEEILTCRSAVGTVKAHVKAIMSKLEASSRTQAVSVAVQRGLVAPQMPDAAVSTLNFMTGQRASAWAAPAYA